MSKYFILYYTVFLNDKFIYEQKTAAARHRDNNKDHTREIR